MNINDKYLRRYWVALIIASLTLFLPSCILPDQKIASRSSAGFKVATLQERIFSDTVISVETPILVNPEDQAIHLYGTGGETLYFQLIVPPNVTGPAGLRLESMIRTSSVSISTNTLSFFGPDAWRVYQIVSIPVNTFDAVIARSDGGQELKARAYPDPLVELKPDSPGKFVVSKSENENAILLLELTIPRRTPAATFTGQVILTWAGQDYSRTLNLHSWGFDLPDPGIGIFGVINVADLWVQHEFGSLRDGDRLILPSDPDRVKLLADALGPYCRILSENGVEPWLGNVYPRIFGEGQENLGIDFVSYKTLADVVLKNATQARKYWPVPLSLNYPATQTFGPYDSPSFRQVVRMFLAQFNERILSSGLAGKGIAALGWRNGYRSMQDVGPSYAALAGEIRRFDPALGIINPFIPIDLRPLGWSDFKPFDPVTKAATVLCPQERWLDSSAIEGFTRSGGQVWWRPGDGDGALPTPITAYPTCFAQALAWGAYRYSSQGIVLAQVNPEPSNSSSGPDNFATCKALVYPGRWFGQLQPLGSLRLKRIKAGLQDVSYLRALDRAGRKDAAGWLARSLIRYAHADACDGSIWSIRNDGVCRTPQAWALARLIAGMDLSVALTPATTQPIISNLGIKRKVFAGQFRDLTGGVALELEGVRAKNVLDIQTGGRKIEWAFHTAVRNFSEPSGEGTLAFRNLPSTQSPIRDRVKVSRMPWAWPVRQTLHFETPATAPGFYGILHQPIGLRMDDETEIRVDGRYAALVALGLEQPVEVDGGLDDWPEAPASAAGNFLRIAPDGITEKETGASTRAAAWSTTVKIGFTGQTLYLAFTCMQPRQTLATRSSNTVDSSAGLPWGEDFVEVMLDPNNSDSLNPLDVYHLVVKANGSGFGFRGPINAAAQTAAGVWPNNIRTAVKVFEDRWQAEVAVPLADVKCSQPFNRWWGVDFVRFVAAGSEMSSWSGAKNPCGKPIALGNVYLAR